MFFLKELISLSLERVKFRISKFFSLPIKACSTIWRWFIKFAKEAPRSIINGLGSLLHADETKVRTNKKGKYFWFWAIKCSKTKAIRTDNLRSYYPVIREVLGYNVEHDKFISLKEHNNNEIENLNQQENS